MVARKSARCSIGRAAVSDNDVIFLGEGCDRILGNMKKGFRADCLMPFGAEYAHAAKWGFFQRIFIRTFGVVDLPTRIRARAIFACLAPQHKYSTIDLGAGTGVYSLAMSRSEGVQVLAIEIDSARAQLIRDLAKRSFRGNIRVISGGAHSLQDLEASSYSLVIAVEVLQYLEDLSSCLSDVHAVLRPGGRLIAHVPIRSSLWPWERRLFRDQDLAALFQRAGFDRVTTRATFSPTQMRLCKVFGWLSRRPRLLAVVYPMLLLGVVLSGTWAKDGMSRVIEAVKGGGCVENQQGCNASTGG